MTTCNGHYLSLFWCHTLVNRMQLGLHWCVALAARRATAKRFCDSSDPASWAVRLWCSIRICWPAASAMNSFIPLESATLSLNLLFSVSSWRTDRCGNSCGHRRGPDRARAGKAAYGPRNAIVFINHIAGLSPCCRSGPLACPLTVVSGAR